jgi:acetyl-CoA carboxylase biotin carboxyl carrier protein
VHKKQKSVLPHTMNLKELKELIEFLKEKDIAEFELERGDVKVRIRRGSEPVVSASQAARFFSSLPAESSSAEPGAAPATPSPPAATPPVVTQPPMPEEGLHIVRSPIVGTFYEAPSPGAPPFVKPGDIVEAGQILCIVEAMKLMNEIESDVAGEIVKRLVANNAPIEYGQELFAIRPRS